MTPDLRERRHQSVPACFVLLGNGTGAAASGTPLHSRIYDFNDEMLDLGVESCLALVRQQLPEVAA